MKPPAKRQKIVQRLGLRPPHAGLRGSGAREFGDSDQLCAVYSWALTKISNLKRIRKNDNMQPIVSAPDQPGKITHPDAAAAPFKRKIGR
jgi:hypothetical protein